MLLISIVAWLLAGFCGAYIGHRWAEGGYNDTRMLSVLLMTAFGPITLGMVIAFLLCVKVKYSKFFHMVVFKGKV